MTGLEGGKQRVREVVGRSPDGDGGTPVAGLLPGPFGGTNDGGAHRRNHNDCAVTLIMRRPVTGDDAAEMTCPLDLHVATNVAKVALRPGPFPFG
jgi:hypothetical protein